MSTAPVEWSVTVDDFTAHDAPDEHLGAHSENLAREIVRLTGTPEPAVFHVSYWPEKGYMTVAPWAVVVSE